MVPNLGAKLDGIIQYQTLSFFRPLMMPEPQSLFTSLRSPPIFKDRLLRWTKELDLATLMVDIKLEYNEPSIYTTRP